MVDGHKPDNTSSVTYSTVVSRDSFIIRLKIAAMNDINILATDTENAYLISPCQEKVWMQYSPEFGNLEGKLLVVKKALYSLEYLGTALRAFLAETFDDIGFRSSIDDPDVWMRAATKPIREKYCEYILCYVDDILYISHNSRYTMGGIQNNMKFNNDKIENPDFYLGVILKNKELNV